MINYTLLETRLKRLAGRVEQFNEITIQCSVCRYMVKYINRFFFLSWLQYSNGRKRPEKLIASWNGSEWRRARFCDSELAATGRRSFELIRRRRRAYVGRKSESGGYGYAGQNSGRGVAWCRRNDAATPRARVFETNTDRRYVEVFRCRTQFVIRRNRSLPRSSPQGSP